MKCPKCKHKDALLLLNTVKCINKDCDNYDESWAREVDKNKQELVTSDDDVGAIYLGPEDLYENPYGDDPYNFLGVPAFYSYFFTL